MADDRTLRGEIKSALQDAAKEMGFAVDDIRKEVVEKGWFGQEQTPDVAGDWLRDDLPQKEAGEVSREDLYGHDPETQQNLEQDHDLER